MVHWIQRNIYKTVENIGLETLTKKIIMYRVSDNLYNTGGWHLTHLLQYIHLYKVCDIFVFKTNVNRSNSECNHFCLYHFEQSLHCFFSLCRKKLNPQNLLTESETAHNSKAFIHMLMLQLAIILHYIPWISIMFTEVFWGLSHLKLIYTASK